MTKGTKRRVRQAIAKIMEAVEIINTASGEESDIYDTMAGTEKEKADILRNIKVLDDAGGYLKDQADELRRIAR